MANSVSNSSHILETRDLVKRFGGLSAVDHLNFTLADKGRLHAIIGPPFINKVVYSFTISMVAV